MKLNILTLLLAFLLFNVSCNSFYVVSEHGIKYEHPFSRNFEISQLKVDSIHTKKKYPVKYNKQMTFICSIDHNKDNAQAFLNKQYQSVEDYWKDYDKLDSVSQFFLNKRGSEEILFFEEQNHVNWIKYPFSTNELVSSLPVNFEKNTWYKVSHLYPRHYDLNHVVFFIIDNKGKVRNFQLIE